MGLLAALLLIPVIPYALATGTVTIASDSKYYKPGDTVTLSGIAVAGLELTITVNNTQALVYKEKFTVEADGKYTKTFPLQNDAYIGVYRAKANDESNVDETHFIVSKITPADLADNMIKLAEDAQARTEKLFSELTTQGVNISNEAQNDHNDGVAAINDAKTKLTDGHPWEALLAAQKAMMHFRDAIQDAWKSAKVDKTEDNPTDKLNAAVQRGQSIVEKLDAAIAKLEGEGKDVTSAKTDLSEAKKQLDLATASLTAGKTDDAKKQLDAVKDALEKVFKDLKPYSAELAHECALKFVKEMDDRIEILKAQLGKLRNERNKWQVDNVVAKLQEAKGKISEAIAWLRNGKDGAAFRALQSADYEVNIGIGNLDSGKASSNLSNINMLQAKIQFLQRTEQQMLRWGIDAHNIQTQIAELQAQLTAAQQVTTP